MICNQQQHQQPNSSVSVLKIQIFNIIPHNIFYPEGDICCMKTFCVEIIQIKYQTIYCSGDNSNNNMQNDRYVHNLKVYHTAKLAENLFAYLNPHIISCIIILYCLPTEKTGDTKSYILFSDVIAGSTSAIWCTYLQPVKWKSV